MSDPNFIEEAWDKKKIFMGIGASLILVSGVFYGVKTLGLFTSDQQQQSSVRTSAASVEGASVQANEDTPTPEPTRPGISFPSKSDIEKKLTGVKDEITQLNVQEIASSSPQVQKVLRDIQALGQYPGNQAKEMCQRLCSNL